MRYVVSVTLLFMLGCTEPSVELVPVVEPSINVAGELTITGTSVSFSATCETIAGPQPDGVVKVLGVDDHEQITESEWLTRICYTPIRTADRDLLERTLRAIQVQHARYSDYGRKEEHTQEKMDMLTAELAKRPE